MVLCGNTLEKRKDLLIVPVSITAQRYSDLILNYYVLLTSCDISSNLKLKQNNVGTTEFNKWLPLSPKLNNIEHIWNFLYKRIQMSSKRT